jgi:hypothetical protein
VALLETPNNLPNGLLALLGQSLDIEADLLDGTFKMTVTIPFTEAELADIGLTASHLDQLDLRFFDASTMNWELAVAGNCGNPPTCDAGATGTRFQIEGPATRPPPSSTVGDYGVLFNTITRAGYVFAVVDHWTEFGLGVRVAADLDGDWDVDGTDFLTFSICYNGAAKPPQSGCGNSHTDLDRDGDVDGFDFITFVRCFNGSNRPPKCVD